MSSNNLDLEIRIKTGPKDAVGEVFSVDLATVDPDGSLSESQREGFATAWEFVEAAGEAEDGEELAAIMAIGLAISYGVVRLVNRIKMANNTTILFASLNPDCRLSFDKVEIEKGELAEGLSKAKIKDTTLRVKDSYTDGLMFSSFGRSWGRIEGRCVENNKATEFILSYKNKLGSDQGKSSYNLVRVDPSLGPAKPQPYPRDRAIVHMEENPEDENRQDIVTVLFL